jgi:hypothetical protein
VAAGALHADLHRRTRRRRDLSAPEPPPHGAGDLGNAKIFVLPPAPCIRICTAERGGAAI